MSTEHTNLLPTVSDTELRGWMEYDEPPYDQAQRISGRQVADILGSIVVEGASDDDGSSNLRTQVATAMAALTGREEAGEVLVASAHHPAEEVRATALRNIPGFIGMLPDFSHLEHPSEAELNQAHSAALLYGQLIGEARRLCDDPSHEVKSSAVFAITYSE